jgi:acyl carrier protein
MSETLAALKRIVGVIKGDPAISDRLTDDADLIGEVGLDSIEMLRFMLEIEASLAVDIDFDKLDFAYLHSLRALADLLDGMRRVPASQAG